MRRLKQHRQDKDYKGDTIVETILTSIIPIITQSEPVHCGERFCEIYRKKRTWAPLALNAEGRSRKEKKC